MALLKGGHLSIRSSKRSIQERCHANLHLAWSIHFRRRQRHAENREEAVAKLFKIVGGRLIGWYLTFGHHDWLAIGEFPDEKAAAAAVLAAAAGGSLSEVETTVAMTAKDAATTFESAGKAAREFRSAGRP
jgi:uncharacterized protein with GYD domain